MRLLADENVPLPSVETLVAAGHDVVSIREVDPGASDAAVLARSSAEHRVLITFDRDFGELVFRAGLQIRPGVIYLRFVPVAPWEAGSIVADLLGATGMTVEGHFTVVERDHVRQRRLP